MEKIQDYTKEEHSLQSCPENNTQHISLKFLVYLWSNISPSRFKATKRKANCNSTKNSSRSLQEKNVSLYMERVKAKIEEELLRARRFLHASSLSKVSQRCETHMVAEHLEFLYSECTAMVQGERKKDLSNM